MSHQFDNSIRDSGLSIPSWRILASLYGNVSRDLADLEARTFIDTEVLKDNLVVLQRDGLCTVDETDSLSVTATIDGHKRVEHLFSHGEKTDKAAVGGSGEEDVQRLVSMLGGVVKNMNDLNSKT